jgi:RNA polymerase primary sigma factor
MEINKNKAFEDSLSIYMKEASDIPLLERAEEQELVMLVRKWLDSSRARQITKKRGMEARNKLIKSNLRLVIKIAKDYRNLGLDFADLISEGNIGLMQGVEKFMPQKGAKLSYYASFWIKQSIRRAISNKGRTIRLPVAVVDIKMKIAKFIDEFNSEHFREPTHEEIAESLDIKLDKVKKIARVNFQSRSLHEKLSDEKGAELGDIIENPDSGSPLSFTLNEDDKRVLNSLLRQLDIRQQYIIKYRFGLGDVESQTLETIGKRFNLTRERIRQLENIALDHLREMYKKIHCTSYKR